MNFYLVEPRETDCPRACRDEDGASRLCCEDEEEGVLGWDREPLRGRTDTASENKLFEYAPLTLFSHIFIDRIFKFNCLFLLLHVG